MNAAITRSESPAGDCSEWALVIQVPHVEIVSVRSLFWFRVKVTMWLIGLLWRENAGRRP